MGWLYERKGEGQENVKKFLEVEGLGGEWIKEAENAR